MVEENVQTEEDLVFPEESAQIIEAISKKYGLIKERGEMIKKLESLYKDQTKTFDEKMGLIEDFPESKLAKLVSDYGYKKIPFEEIPDRIEKELGLNKDKSKKMAMELKTTLLDLIKINTKTEVKNLASVKKFNTAAKNKTPVIQENRSRSVKADAYQESIE
jgi:hypothetical protein